MKLKSMTDFVLEQNIRFANKEITIEELELRNLKMAQFLKQKLELSMFVPCKEVDGKWVVLEEPKNIHDHYDEKEYIDGSHLLLRAEYQQAKERVLFEGCEGAINLDRWIKNKTVEDLIGDDDITLTPTVQKQIGL